MQFHTHIDTKQEKIQVKPQTHTPVHGYAASQIPERELRQFVLVGTCVSQCPDVSCIDENSAPEFPVHVETVFHIGLQLHVAGLVRNNERLVHRCQSRTDRPCLPSSKTAGPARIEMLFER